ncbi:Dystroglycan-type cadherin-like domain protein, partial [Rhizoctonia solani]
MFRTMRLLVAYVLLFLVLGQLCLAAPVVATPAFLNIIRRAESVIVNRPATVQNVPVAQLHVPYAFQLDPKTFLVVNSDSGVISKTQTKVAWDRNSNAPTWLSFDPDKLIFSGTPDSVPDRPIRLRLVATAPESGDQNDTAFDLHISDSASPNLINTLESQQNHELIRLDNASYLTLSTGVWIHPGAAFSVQFQAFCSGSTKDSTPYYNAYHPSNITLDPLPRWLKFDNNSLTFSGIAPMEPTATDVVVRCSNVFGAGGPEQRMSFEIDKYILELEDPVLPFQFTPGRMFTYNFHWLWHQLYLNGEFFAQAFSHMQFSNDSQDVPGLDVKNSDDIGISFALDDYPWLSFDRVNQTIYGIPPIMPVLPDFPPISLNITCRGREINTDIYVTSLASSAWNPSPRPASITIRPGVSFTYDFTLELMDSVASNPDWDVFVRFDDPFDQTSWLRFDPTTRVLSGTVPIDSPPREITVLATSNAWGFNTTTSYLVIVDNPTYAPPAPRIVWNQTTIALLVSLIIVVLFVVMTVCICYGLREGCLVSYPTLIEYYRGSRPSSQTLVGDDCECATGCCSALESRSKSGDSRPHTEKAAKEETHTASHDVREQCDFPDLTQMNATHHPFDSSAVLRSEIVPVDCSSPSAISSAAQARLNSHITKPQAKPVPEHGRKNLIFKKRALFRKGNRKNTNNRKSPTVVSTTKPEAVPFTPLWNGHIYQTPELLAADERNWQVRRQERKARLKQEYLAHKQAENTGIEERADTPEEKHDTSNLDVPRRFGIFERLAAMEDLDRKGPVNMRGQAFPLSRLVEVGENRFFDDTMLDRSEVGSSEFSSLASWETLSESSLPNMVLCYGQLGRRKTKEDPFPHGIHPAVDLSLAIGRHTQEFGGLAKDSLTDEKQFNQIAHGPGSRDTSNYDLPVYDTRNKKIQKPFQKISNIGNVSTTIAYSSAQWKGKGVACGEHGSPTTSQHSPTFKKLARQRFRASLDDKLGSPLSRMARTVAYTSPSPRSIGSMISRSNTNLPTSVSLGDVFLHLGLNGMQFYFVPAKTQFRFKVQVPEAAFKKKDKSKCRRPEDALLEAETDGHFNTSMPDWVEFDASAMEFWGQTPDTRELLQYSIRVVSRPTNKVVCQLLMVVARPPLLSAAKASLTDPAEVMDTPFRGSPGSLYSLNNLRTLESPLQSSRSVVASNLGTNLSARSISSIFRFNQDGVEVFVIPAATNFCFEVLVPKLDGESSSGELALGRTTASSYSIQLEECDVISIPHWLHFVPSTVEFWGEAPSVERRLHIVIQIIHKESGQVARCIAIVITNMDDAAQLRAHFGCSDSGNEGLSVVEEVSSVVSNDIQGETSCTMTWSSRKPFVLGGVSPGIQTPERPQNPVPSSSKYVPSSWHGISPGSRRTLAYTSPSRRNLGLGTPGSRSVRRLRMRTPMSARQSGCEDYDSVMFEGHSYYSESLCGPELTALVGHTIPSGTLDVISRAASRQSSIRLSADERSILINPTTMDDVDYYVIPRGVDFRFLISLPIVKITPNSGCDPKYDVLVEPQTKDGWKFPEWLHATIDEELRAVKIIGSTHDVVGHEEHTLIIYSMGNDKEVKRARVVVALDVNT